MNRQDRMLETFTGAAVKNLATNATGGVNSLVLQMVQAPFRRMILGLVGIFTVGALDHRQSSADPVRG